MPQPVGVGSLWPYLREHRSLLIVVGLFSLVGAATSLATPLLTRAVISALENQTPIQTALTLLIVAMIFGALIDGVVRYLLEKTAQGVVLNTRIRLASALIRLPINEFDQRRTGDLISRIGADTTLVSAVVTSGLVELASGAIVAVGAIVLMALVDPLMLGVTLLAVIVGVGSVLLVSRRIRPLSEVAQAAVGAMTASVERVLGAARRVFHIGERAEVVDHPCAIFALGD